MEDLLEQTRELCKAFPSVYEDYPFGEEWQVYRHRLSKKSFALLYRRNGSAQINLKCDPVEAEFWRRVYPGAVTPGYHMNKTHWNTVLLDGSLPWEDLRQMVEHSYEITRPGKKKGVKKSGI